MRIDTATLLRSLAEHDLEAVKQLREEVRGVTRDGLNLDRYALTQANPFMRAVVARSQEGATEGSSKTGRGGALFNALDDLPVVLASLFADCVREDGAIDEALVAQRYGAQAGRIFAQAARSANDPAAHPLANDRGLAVRLASFDNRLLDAVGGMKGVPTGMAMLDRSIARLEGKKPLKRFNAVFVQHLFAGQLPFFEALRQAGLDPKNTFIAGRGYSDSDLVRQLAGERGYTVLETPKSGMGSYEEAQRQQMRKMLTSAVARAKTNGNSILLIDDGGLAVRMVHEEFGRYAHLFHCVEQTTRGITEVSDIALKAPLVNVARSRGKEAEAPFIAEVVMQKLLYDLAALGRGDMQDREVAVFGYGFIGKQVSQALRKLGAHVTVLEIDANKRSAARADGFAVDQHDSRALGQFDMVVGTTGHRSIGPEQLVQLRDGATLVSTSSAEVEIDTRYLRTESMQREVAHRGAYESNHTNLECNLGGRRLLLLNGGKPINFDGRPVGVPNEKIQLTHALLFEGALQAAQCRSQGLHDVDGAVQDRLLADLRECADLSSGVPGEADPPPVAELPALAFDVTTDRGRVSEVLGSACARARQRRDCLVNGSEILVPAYPGFDRPVLINPGLDAVVVLDKCDGDVLDFTHAGQSLLVTVRAADRSEKLLAFDMPPTAVNADNEVLPSIQAARRSASLSGVSALAVVSEIALREGGQPEGVSTLVTCGCDGVRFLDLDSGDQGQVAGLPSDLQPERLELLADKRLVVDRAGGRVFLLAPGCRQVERQMALRDVGDPRALALPTRPLEVTARSGSKVRPRAVVRQAAAAPAPGPAAADPKAALRPVVRRLLSPGRDRAALIDELARQLPPSVRLRVGDKQLEVYDIPTGVVNWGPDRHEVAVVALRDAGGHIVDLAMWWGTIAPTLVGNGLVRLHRQTPDWSHTLHRDALVPVSELGMRPLPELVHKYSADSRAPVLATEQAIFRLVDGVLERFDPSSGEVRRGTQRVDPKGAIHDQPVMALAAPFGQLAVVEPENDQVVLLDATTLAESARLKLPGGWRPYTVSFDPARGVLVQAHRPPSEPFGLDNRTELVLALSKPEPRWLNAQDASTRDADAEEPRLELSELHPKLRAALAKHCSNGDDKTVTLERLALRQLALPVPGTDAFIFLSVSPANEGYEGCIPPSLFERVVKALNRGLRGADRARRPGDAVDLTLAREIIAGMREDAQSNEPPALSQRLYGSHEQRMNLALVLGGDIVLDDLFALPWRPHDTDLMIHGGPRAWGHMLDELVAFQTRSGFEPYMSFIEPAGLWRHACDIARNMSAWAKMDPPLQTRWQQLLDTFGDDDFGRKCRGHLERLAGDTGS